MKLCKYYLFSLLVLLVTGVFTSDKVPVIAFAADFYNCNGMYQTTPCQKETSDRDVKRAPAKILPHGFSECVKAGGNRTFAKNGEACFFRVPPELIPSCFKAGGNTYTIGEELNCTVSYMKTPDEKE